MRSRKPLLLLVIALFATALVAVGCGSSSSNSSSDTSAATPPASTPATPPASTPATPPATTDTSGGGGAAANPQIQAAIDACKQQIAAAPGLKDATKADLNKICEDIKSGNAADIQKVAKEVCGKIIDDSGLPDGPAKDQAKMACNSVGG